MAQVAQNLPAMWEIWVQALGQEDPLEEGMTTHSSILAWRIPWTEERAAVPGAAKSQTRLSNTHILPCKGLLTVALLLLCQTISPQSTAA